MKYVIIVLLYSILLGCNQEPIKQIDIKELIKKNENKQVFLSFWSNMSDHEFQSVKKYEFKKGNLVNNGNYFRLYLYNSTSEENSIDFKLLRFSDGIELTFAEEIKQPYVGFEKDYRKFDQTRRGEFYKQAKNKIIQLFSSKYDRIVYKNDSIKSLGIYHSDNIFRWFNKTNLSCTRITLNVDYGYYSFDKDQVMGPRHNPEKEIAITAKANFRITYESCESIIRMEEKKKEEIIRNQERIKEETENSEKHNEKL